MRHAMQRQDTGGVQLGGPLTARTRQIDNESKALLWERGNREMSLFVG